MSRFMKWFSSIDVVIRAMVITALVGGSLAVGLFAYPLVVEYRAEAEAISIAERAVNFEVAGVQRIEPWPPRGKPEPGCWLIQLEGKPTRHRGKDAHGNSVMGWDHRGASVLVDLKARKAVQVLYCY